MIKKLTIILTLVFMGLASAVLADSLDSLGEAPESSSLEYRETLGIKSSKSEVGTSTNQELIYGEKINILTFNPETIPFNPGGEINKLEEGNLDDPDFLGPDDAMPGGRLGDREPPPPKPEEPASGGGGSAADGGGGAAD